MLLNVVLAREGEGEGEGAAHQLNLVLQIFCNLQNFSAALDFADLCSGTQSTAQPTLAPK